MPISHSFQYGLDIIIVKNLFAKPDFAIIELTPLHHCYYYTEMVLLGLCTILAFLSTILPRRMPDERCWFS